MRATRLPSPIQRFLTPLLIASIAVIAGLMIRNVPDIPVPVWLASGPAFVLIGFVLSRSARLCLALLILVDVLGLYRGTFEVGPIGLRSIDALWFALIIWTILERQAHGPARRANVGQRQLLLFLAAIGTSLLPLVVGSSDGAIDNVVAWARLVQTMSLVVLVPYAAQRVDDAEFVLGAVQIAAAIEITRAIVGAFLADDLGGRISGGNGPNTAGLLAAILVVMAVHSPLPRSVGLRLATLLLGSAGLVMARSLGALVALTAGLAIFGLRPVHAGRSRSSALLTPARLILVIVAATLLAMTIRSENLPVSDDFNRSSTIHRVILAEAGIELFRENPIFGVGWQESGNAIQSKEVNERLRSRYGSEVNPDFFPDRNPTSVHNAYVQVPTEAGVIGLVGFIIFAVGCIRGVRIVLRRLVAHARAYASARCAVAVVVVIAVWYNDNPFFGAQPETVIAATMLGLVAALGARDVPTLAMPPHVAPRSRST